MLAHSLPILDHSLVRGARSLTPIPTISRLKFTVLHSFEVTFQANYRMYL